MHAPIMYLFKKIVSRETLGISFQIVSRETLNDYSPSTPVPFTGT